MGRIADFFNRMSEEERVKELFVKRFDDIESTDTHYDLWRAHHYMVKKEGAAERFAKENAEYFIDKIKTLMLDDKLSGNSAVYKAQLFFHPEHLRESPEINELYVQLVEAAISKIDRNSTRQCENLGGLIHHIKWGAGYEPSGISDALRSRLLVAELKVAEFDYTNKEVLSKVVGAWGVYGILKDDQSSINESVCAQMLDTASKLQDPMNEMGQFMLLTTLMMFLPEQQAATIKTRLQNELQQGIDSLANLATMQERQQRAESLVRRINTLADHDVNLKLRGVKVLNTELFRDITWQEIEAREKSSVTIIEFNEAATLGKDVVSMRVKRITLFNGEGENGREIDYYCGTSSDRDTYYLTVDYQAQLRDAFPEENADIIKALGQKRLLHSIV